MKNYLKGLVITAIVLTLGILNVNAVTATKKIDKSACETVYTNYYFFLDANTDNFFNKSALSGLTHLTRAEYNNNSYLTRFDSKNIGYGQIEVNTGTSTNGLKTMSLNDYYTIYLKAMRYNGAFTDGNENYIVSHDWYRVENNQWVDGGNGLNLSNYTKSSLIRATVNANATIKQISGVKYTKQNPFVLEIDRQYYGYLTDSPITYGNNNWYLHPAVYYIQYCEEIDEKDEYVIEYEGNGSNVTNVPKDDYYYEDECTTISKQKPIREGYTFLGWSENKKATKADRDYALGSVYCDGNLRLYAIWKKTEEANTPVVYTYTVNYNSNTSDYVTNMPTNLTVNSTENATISTMIPVREGYTFLGWSTDASATIADSNFKGGTLYTDRKDLVLYAIWQKNQVVLPENPQTGIEDYLLPFGGTIVVSLLGLTVLKKKKSFRQF